jgi:hypothetical protein
MVAAQVLFKNYFREYLPANRNPPTPHNIIFSAVLNQSAPTLTNRLRRKVTKAPLWPNWPEMSLSRVISVTPEPATKCRLPLHLKGALLQQMLP